MLQLRRRLTREVSAHGAAVAINNAAMVVLCVCGKHISTLLLCLHRESGREGEGV